MNLEVEDINEKLNTKLLKIEKKYTRKQKYPGGGSFMKYDSSKMSVSEKMWGFLVYVLANMVINLS